MSPNPALPSSHLKGDLEGLDQAPEDDQPLRAHSHPDVAGPARSPHQPAVHVQLQPLRGDAESHSVPAPVTELGNREPVLPRGVGKRQNTKFGSDSSRVSPGLHPHQLPGSLSIHPQWKGGAVIFKTRNHHAWLYKKLLAGEKQPGSLRRRSRLSPREPEGWCWAAAAHQQVQETVQGCNKEPGGAPRSCQVLLVLWTGN